MAPIYILGTSGKIKNPDDIEISKLLQIAGANTGNLMFQYAVSRMIGNEKRFIGIDGMPYLDAGDCSDGAYLVFPAANHLRAGADWSGLCSFFENLKIPLVLIGLGAQADSSLNIEETARNLIQDSSCKRLIDVLKSKAALITVRGKFTADLCKILDIPNVEILGCPSLMLNPNANAGQQIAEKISHLETNQHVKMALTAAAPFEIRGSHKNDLEKILFRITKRQNGLYVQQSGGDSCIAIAGRRFGQLSVGGLKSIRDILAPDLSLDEFLDYHKDKGRVFTSAEQWIESLKPFDLCFGTRLHGNMAAIAGGTPGCVIHHDSRTEELAQEMQLPQIRAEEISESESMATLLTKIQFDANAFDRSRTEKARKYKQLFDGLGIEPCLDHL
jgi:hypothetical protein